MEVQVQDAGVRRQTLCRRTARPTRASRTVTTGLRELPNVRIIGSKLTLCSKRELLQAVEDFVKQRCKAVVLSGNVHSFNMAYSHPWYKTYLNRADMVRLDGAGLRLGARLLGHATPPRMTWADFAWDLAELCQQRKFSLFFLGSRSGVAHRAAHRLSARFPRLRIVGVQHGYFDKRRTSSENRAVLEAIDAASPDILIVGFGMPLQERWLLENAAEIRAHVIFTGGAVFDYVSGTLWRGPQWMTEHGLEWLARLIIEPRRLARRYLIGNPLFIGRVLRQRFSRPQRTRGDFAATAVSGGRRRPPHVADGAR